MQQFLGAVADDRKHYQGVCKQEQGLLPNLHAGLTL